MAANTRLAELLLPVLALPFFVPIVLPAAQSTARLLVRSSHCRSDELVENPDCVRHCVRRRVRARVSVHARRLALTLDDCVHRPRRDDRRALRLAADVAVVAVAATFVRAIFFTPIEARQGPAQKIFYVHAPSAFIGLYVAFGLVAVAGVLTSGFATSGSTASPRRRRKSGSCS